MLSERRVCVRTLCERRDVHASLCLEARVPPPSLSCQAFWKGFLKTPLTAFRPPPSSDKSGRRPQLHIRRCSQKTLEGDVAGTAAPASPSTLNTPLHTLNCTAFAIASAADNMSRRHNGLSGHNGRKRKVPTTVTVTFSATWITFTLNTLINNPPSAKPTVCTMQHARLITERRPPIKAPLRQCSHRCLRLEPVVVVPTPAQQCRRREREPQAQVEAVDNLAQVGAVLVASQPA